MAAGLIIDTLRGDDSTGMFYQSRGTKGTAGWYKACGPGYDFTLREKFGELQKEAHKHWFAVGHNRAATIGSVTSETAHPFQVGPVTLVHNGTVRNTNTLPLPMAELDGVTVDSHCLTHNLALVGPDEVEDLLREVRGGFTLVWHDVRDGSLNFIRNAQRPLHFVQSKANNSIYFASEAAQLRYLNEKLKLAGDAIMAPRPGFHLKFKEGDLEPEVREYNLTPKPVKAAGRKNTKSGATGGGSNSPKSRASRPYTTNPNQILMGGRLQSIPSQLRKILSKENLAPENRLKMTPMQQTALVGDDGFCLIAGYLDTLSMNALIYRTDAQSARTHFNERWMVRPIAIKYSGPEGKEPVVIVKLVSFGAHGCTEDVTAPSIDENGASNVLYQGPEGPIPVKEWLSLTEEGCVLCTDIVFPREAETLSWYEGEPVCQDCRKFIDQGEVAWFAGAIQGGQDV